MKCWSSQVVLLLAVAGLLWSVGGCSISGSAETYNQNIEGHPIDGLNRDVTENQGGAVHEAPSLNPPPVRPDFATDR